MSSVRPLSTSLPAYITWMCSQCSATTPRSWVTIATAALNSCFKASIRSRICAWTVTSSAVVGSSAISRSGFSASAIAIIARWRIPPENSWGYCFARRSGCAIRTRSSISTARPNASFFETSSCVVITSAIWSPTL